MSTSFDAFILKQGSHLCYQPAFAYSQLEVAISFYQKRMKNDRGSPPLSKLFSLPLPACFR